jgi:hypothetical protein
MKSSIFTRFLLLCLVLAGWSQMSAVADEVSKNQALAIAAKVVSNYFPTDLKLSSSNIRISSGLSLTDPFYVCNVGEKGFVLVAKSENYPPILGFSWESNFPAQEAGMPDLMKTVINSIKTQCEDYDSRDTVNPLIVQKWQALTSAKAVSPLKTGVVSPLLATSWDCDSSFFELFPRSFKNGGSVPIAMGQVFRYYAQPTNGVDRLCYVLNGYGELCTQMNQAKFRFDRMSNTLGNPSVDTLIYYMAVSCMMQPEGAALEAYKTTLPLYFSYSPEMRVVESWNYNIGEVVRHQLSLKRPVPADWLGQSFVIDGYFPDNLFHFNMGWGGELNGFYLIDYPVVKVDSDHSLLSCYTDYHPKSLLPGVTNLTAVAEGDSIRVSWNTNMSDSVRANLVRFVVLKDGLIPVAQTTQSTVVLSPAVMGAGSVIRVVADFGTHGASELSLPVRCIFDQTIADIPSLALRQMINTKLGASDLLRQPFVGELDLIRDLEINFVDQRGLEKLPQLKNLRIDGTNIRVLREGDYLERLLHLRFFNCIDFNYTAFGKTRALIQLYGYDFLPFDLYEFRHNSDLGLLQFTTTGTNPNMLMDLYGADKYFPKLADFFLRHLSAGPGANYENCFVSIESYLDFYPKIKSNQNLLTRTQPSIFAPCYPSPVRNANLPAVTRLTWQCNTKSEPGVFYNVFVGNSRATLELVSVFQMDKFYDGTFEPNNEYYWRVEAYHADSTYYSGIYHFSTWQDLPIPFVDRFDDYYSACPIADESFFWVNFDNALTGKAVANRNVKFSGFYSMEMKPKSDAGVVIKSPVDPIYYIEFRFLNKGGQVATELLQKSGSSNDNIVNSKIEFLGKDIGLLTFGTSTFPFSFVADNWNRVNIFLNMTTGAATFTLNEVMMKEWQWHVQIGGTANTNPFKGIRFVNNAGTDGASGFIDNLVIDRQNLLSTEPVLNPEIGIVYVPGTREVVLNGIQSGEIMEISLYDLQGRKLITRVNPANLVFPIGGNLPHGVYLIVVSPKNSRSFTSKIAILD